MDVRKIRTSYVLQENVKPLIIAFVEKYYAFFTDVHYVTTFGALKIKYEQVSFYCCIHVQITAH